MKKFQEKVSHSQVDVVVIGMTSQREIRLFRYDVTRLT